MGVKSQNERIIFGLKVKQLRQGRKLSFSSLSNTTGLSISYLNEIEKGKKYPKEDKIHTLANALGIKFEELISPELGKNLAPLGGLLQSNFLNELPLELFGIDLSKVVEIIANSPARVGAFISTLLELSRNYALNEESFYFGALRSYLELHNNYFEELEQEAKRFVHLYDIPEDRPVSNSLLRQLLINRFGYTILDNGLDAYPDLQGFRAVFIPGKKQLLLNSQLSPMQKSFEFGKELGFQFLELKERANTSSLLRTRVFEEVLNHSKAIYFSVALHIPLESILEDIKGFFEQKNWNGEAFLAIMARYDASPEMFYHRLTNIIPTFFGLEKLFFLRFVHDLKVDQFEIDRELHLNRRHHPHGNRLFEHYCRRWVSLSIFKALHQENGQANQSPLVRVQRSRYFGTQDEYLCLTIARPSYPSPNRNVSVSLGLLVTDELREKIKFLDDPNIPLKEVNKTCERCSILDCEDRASPPSVIEKRQYWQSVQDQLNTLLNKKS